MLKIRSTSFGITYFWLRFKLMILYYLIIAWALIGAIAFLYLFKEPAPYGKHAKKTYKYSMGAKTGWILMESPACLLYTSDAADDLLCVDLGGRRIIKKNSQLP